MTFRSIYTALLALLLISCSGGSSPEQSGDEPVVAFQGAEGGGKYATGGRGGMIYHVTTLEDDAKNSGSLRYILSLSGAKIVVFDVAGVIQLKRQLDITEGSLTLCGQSAPGDGICIAGYPVVIKTSNVILRFLRFRMGDLNGVEGDALTCIGRSNILIDHCSFSWSTDECLSCYGNTDFTAQWCFITESLNNSVHAKGAHGYGGIWGGSNATFHHNLVAHHNSRNPRFDHDYVNATERGPIDFVNNVVYNWGSNSAYGGESANATRKINFQNNYYKPGPATKSGVKARLMNPTTKCSLCAEKGTVTPALIYLSGNVMHGSDAVTADNWQGIYPDEAAKKSACVATERFAATQLTMQTAQEAYNAVLQKGGCSLVRDAIDSRIAQEVSNGSSTYKGSNGSANGLIDTPDDVGGWPAYSGDNLPQDSDHDGIPDAWETAHGLNPNSYGDAREHTLDQRYMNIEVYLNSLVEHLY